MRHSNRIERANRPAFLGKTGNNGDTRCIPHVIGLWFESKTEHSNRFAVD